MSKVLFICAAVMAIGALSGCGDSGPETAKVTAKGPVRDVQWFIDHEADREAINAECKNNPGEARDLPNCINVAGAKRKIFYQQASDAAHKLK